MDIKGKEIGIQKKLSLVNADFIAFVEDNPEALEASNFKLLDLHNWLFKLQPWPTFINNKSRKAFQEAAEKLFNLIKGLPKRVFDNNPQKISDYYGISVDQVKQLLEGVTAEYLDNILGRGDFLLSSSGLKCLEYNVVVSLGGMYVPIWESLYLNNPLISRFLKEYNVRTKNENLFSLFLEHVIDAFLPKTSEDKKELNIALVAKGFVKGTETTIGSYLNKLFKKISQGKYKSLSGGIFVCDYQHLEVVDDYLFYNGKKIHVVTEIYSGEVSPGVLEVFKAGHVGLLNGPFCRLLSEKLNLALLSDYETATPGVFTDEEKKIIDKYIPWTRKIVPGFTHYKGEKIGLENFILSNREALVIKPSDGYGGKEVYVGKKTPAHQWGEAVITAMGEKNWVVQELVESPPGIYQAGERGCEPHDMAWGFFVFGSRYTGAWCRVMPQNINKGVINCHQGATVSVIFDVDD